MTEWEVTWTYRSEEQTVVKADTLEEAIAKVRARHAEPNPGFRVEEIKRLDDE